MLAPLALVPVGFYESEVGSHCHVNLALFEFDEHTAPAPVVVLQSIPNI